MLKSFYSTFPSVHGSECSLKLMAIFHIFVRSDYQIVEPMTVGINFLNTHSICMLIIRCFSGKWFV